MSDNENGSFLEKLLASITTKRSIQIIIVVGILVFFNSFFGDFVWDDLPQLLGKDIYHSLSNIGFIFVDHTTMFYRPIPALIWTFIYSLFGPIPFWFHLFQVIMHIGNSILIFLLFKKHFSKVTSLFLSLLFLVHPINVEAVAFIAQLQTVMPLFFGLLAFHVLSCPKMNSVYKYGLLAFLILCAALSKETGLLLIVLLPLYMTCQQPPKYHKSDYISFFISTVTTLLFYIPLKFFLTNNATSEISEPPFLMAHTSLAVRLITLPKMIFFYIVTFLYPKNLEMSQRWLVKTITISDFYLPLLLDFLFFILLGG